MIIQHNIPAMSSYRNYNTNRGGLAKSLEKLSSGYRINRAGDDAAGLAISEKMRAQITGLEVAQKNAKDGISLVQTAEGALTEVHSMLNRMYELAEQSANGTYSDEVDREQLQKEISSLRTEINRIADSSNFNGINLLDGSMSIQEAGTKTVDVQGTDRILKDIKTADDGEDWQVTGKKTILDKKGETTAQKVKFDIDTSKLKFTDSTATAASATKVGNVKLTVGNKTFTIKSDDITISAGDTGADIKTAVLNAIDTMDGTDGVELNGVKWDVSVNGDVITFEQKQNPTNAEEARGNFDVTWDFEADTSANAAGTTMTGQTKAGTEVTQEGKYLGEGSLANTVFKMTEDDIADGATITLGEKTVKLKVGASSTTEQGSADYLVDLSSMEEGEIDLDKALSKISNDLNGVTFDYKWDFVNADGEKVEQTTQFKVGVSDAGDGYPKGLAIQRTNNIDADPTDDARTDRAIGDIDTLAGFFKMNYTQDIKEQKGLTLQIGDTAQDFNKLTVDIKDMHADAMGIGNIDVSTQEGAAAAMDSIKSAINYVSDVRGTLGATQNRLDHTINNLSVMQENIQDAESTIRDTDVAAEMMQFTKWSILNQAAQAMLAQANQLPQGVLQLLG